ncbi:alkaline phosphatase family protein [Motilimonas eburnea]|uniref:alkaline phosphatase family protein n=1 Tax=Motilimonas eburnea TaxID=1737488 RepID=UPI001E527180|nr:alkaline phosphatase family protein [Motilimonas eburnea]MCE2572652.1 alkaline phosphatase family protein [Motilimonas eburnea]
MCKHHTFAIATIALLFSSISLATPNNQPKLVLQITVDGLRGDLLQRYQHNFKADGFRYLMEQGTHYTNAHYQHTNTETIVGHVSLATGAPPSVHGMVGNVWYDRQQARLVYNVEDADYALLSAGAGVDQSSEIDPTQKAAQQDGRSPTPILATTFSDELTFASNGAAKVFAVSIKDRGAISLAGHTGKAFWFSKAKSEFVTSDYYYQSYPDWVTDWNQQQQPKQYSNQSWQLSLAKEKYTLNEISQQHKLDFAGFARTFPHPYGPASFKYFTTMLTLSPAGDELTSDFAQTLLINEGLGKGRTTDYLAISFSSNDYVIHLYGPNSLESEDNLIRLDSTLAKLFKTIDKHVGLANTLIVLSADHGVPEITPNSQQLGLKQAQYFDANQIINQQAIARLKRDFGLDEKAIRLYTQPYIYLDHDVIAKQKVAIADVQQAIAEEVANLAGIAHAITSSDIAHNRLANTRVVELVKNNYHPRRSGDIYLIFEPRTYINDMDGLTIASTHGSPWRYDTHVPVIFAGHHIPRQTINRDITPYDIAPTLSNYLGITLPSGTTGKVLTELKQGAGTNQP